LSETKPKPRALQLRGLQDATSLTNRLVFVQAHRPVIAGRPTTSQMAAIGALRAPGRTIVGRLGPRPVWRPARGVPRTGARHARRLVLDGERRRGRPVTSASRRRVSRQQAPGAGSCSRRRRPARASAGSSPASPTTRRGAPWRAPWRAIIGRLGSTLAPRHGTP
jgi:hypothetical protein